MPRKPGMGRRGAQPTLPNRDHLERANFALQASVFLHQLGAGVGDTDMASAESSDRTAKAVPRAATEGERRRGADYAAVARSEMRALKKWTVHNQVKIDPSIKRAICRGCATVLVPGLTARVRKTTKSVNWTCLECRAVRKFVTPRPSEMTGEGEDTAAPGPRRTVRTPFHLREHAKDAAEGDKGNQDGHVLWRGGKRVDGWGVVETAADEA